jgi:L-rhamnose mutarotase
MQTMMPARARSVFFIFIERKKVFRVYVCNTKQILITFAERRSEQSRTTERDTQKERERERRSSARIRDVFFLDTKEVADA